MLTAWSINVRIGTWREPAENEIPLVQTNMAECPVWARDFDCFTAEGYKNMSESEQAQLKSEAAKVRC